MSEKGFPKKYTDKMDPEFIDNVSAMDTEEIKKKILESEGNLYDIDNAKEKDEELAKIKEEAKNLSAPYRERKAEETAKIKYCLYVLDGRGVSL